MTRHVVIGGGGFLGRALARRLAREGESVTVVGRSPPPPGLPPAADYVRVDASDAHALRAALEKVEGPVGAVHHLAAMSVVDECRRDPAAAFRANVAATQAALDAARALRASAFVLASSGAVYGHQMERPATETDLPSPSSVYAGTKLAAEALVLGHSRDLAFPAAVLRLPNLYGADGHAAAVTTRILADARARREVTIRDGTPRRDFLLVDDAADAFALAAGWRAAEPRIWNVGSGSSPSVREFARAVAGPLGLSVRETGPMGAPSAVLLDVSAIRRELGWRPAHDLASGVRAALAQPQA